MPRRLAGIAPLLAGIGCGRSPVMPDYPPACGPTTMASIECPHDQCVAQCPDSAAALACCFSHDTGALLGEVGAVCAGQVHGLESGLAACYARPLGDPVQSWLVHNIQEQDCEFMHAGGDALVVDASTGALVSDTWIDIATSGCE